ncbi:MAG: hypothetical protein WCA35_10210 [Kovacikia sp.]
MPTMTEVEPGIPDALPPCHRESATSYTAVQIANRCGRSDKWCREQRVTLEKIYYWCPEAFKTKTSRGDRYSKFAHDVIIDFQQQTAGDIPLIKDGEVQYDRKGKAKLVLADPTTRLTVEQYALEVWLRHQQKPISLGDATPEVPPNVPADVPIEGELEPEFSSELTRTEIVFEDAPRSLGPAISDDSRLTVQQTTSNLSGLRQRLKQVGQALGDEMGAVFSQSLTNSFHNRVNQEISQLTDVAPESEAPKVSKKNTQKK